MAKFFAVTSKGLVDPLEKEIQSLKYKGIKSSSSGVFFESNWKNLYKANFLLRTATRILLPVLSFEAHTEEELYHKCKKHDFTKYILPHQTLKVEANVQSKIFRDQRYVALKIKDAVVDQFRDQFGERPNVSKQDPDLKIMVSVNNNNIKMSVDTTGESLSYRGYREETTAAPLREHLAAALLDLTGWNPEIPIVDPMCGSGTFVIEAARKALGHPNGRLRENYAFKNFRNFNEKDWFDIREEKSSTVTNLRPKIFAFDHHPQALSAAKSNAHKAGVNESISFKQMDIGNLKNSQVASNEPGFIVVNPPYGDRMDDVEKLKHLYEKMGQVFKNEFSGWQAWVLSGEPSLTQHLRLKSKQKYPVMNGAIECRWIGYDIR